jgi:L-fuculose-phosphate aldolase
MKADRQAAEIQHLISRLEGNGSAVNTAQNSLRFQLDQVPPNAGFGGVEFLTKLFKIYELFLPEEFLDFENALGLPHCAKSYNREGLPVWSFMVYGEPNCTYSSFTEPNMLNATEASVANIVRRAIFDCIPSGANPELASVNAVAAAANGPWRPNTPGIRGSVASNLEPAALFISPAAITIKEDILHAGTKLWQRAYVDGNGGNISARISDEYVICTPTLCSKGDMRAEDLSLVDLNNCQICGDRPQTSEMLLHLEIYKAVPHARAVIHCHPPYATAHAMAGIIPRGNLVPEQVVFVGPVALAPYETPGTMAFARTVLPFVEDHNTILLTNHGVVCCADTVEHAEWYVEVAENYCKTLVIASQLGVPLGEIPANKIGDLLAMKERLGLPDPRLQTEVAAQSKPPVQNSPAMTSANLRAKDVEELITSITSQLLAFLKVRLSSLGIPLPILSSSYNRGRSWGRFGRISCAAPI